MSNNRLRDLISQAICSFKQHLSHNDIPEFCSSYMLPEPADEGSKGEKLKQCISKLPDCDLSRVANTLISDKRTPLHVKFDIQEELWETLHKPRCVVRYRMEIARSIDDDLFLSRDGFVSILEKYWNLDNFTFGDFLNENLSLRDKLNNLHVWNCDQLFKDIGAYECSYQRFAFFLEDLASYLVRPDLTRQRDFVKKVNLGLVGSGLSLQEVDEQEGFPVFSLTSYGPGSQSRPKNLIFASATKPDIRISDALNNDIEVVDNEDSVLIFDRPIGTDGLTWTAMQTWWSDENKINDHNKAKKSLYLRLLRSLPESSPPQVTLFKSFFKHFKEKVHVLPALLPEVWLHWDPKTVNQRGPKALLRFRMDFLLLLPGNKRIVIEVDGKHHYSHPSGQAAPDLYSKMVAADRELKLSGYDVYRFGAAELLEKNAEYKTGAFFEELFLYHGVL